MTTTTGSRLGRKDPDGAREAARAAEANGALAEGETNKANGGDNAAAERAADGPDGASAALNSFSRSPPPAPPPHASAGDEEGPLPTLVELLSEANEALAGCRSSIHRTIARACSSRRARGATASARPRRGSS